MTKRIPLSSDLFVTHAKEIEKVLQQAVREAYREHKRAGHSIVIWRDGQVVVLPPDEIPVDDLTEDGDQ